MSRVLVVAGLGGLAFAAACVSLSGLSAGVEVTGPIDSGADVAPAEAATPTDPCSHATYPPPPLKDDDPLAEVPSFAVAVREESVTGAIDSGAPIGFDLDGVCSCFADTSTAHAAEPSCIAPEGGAAACDGDGGVDREIDTLLAAYSVPNKGGAAGPTLLMKVSRYNGRANDSEVFVGLVASPGIFDPTSCGQDADAGGSPPYKPTWKGCDRFALEPTSVFPGTTDPRAYLAAYVSDHVLVVPPTDKPVVFVVGDSALLASSAVVVARLVAVDAQLAPIVPAPDVGTVFRMEGVAAGRVNVSEALRALARAEAVTGGGPLCGFSTFFNTVKNSFVCPGADIATSPSNDFRGAVCDALSLAAAFRADPATFGTAQPAPKSACADVSDPRYASFFDCAK